MAFPFYGPRQPPGSAAPAERAFPPRATLATLALALGCGFAVWVAATALAVALGRPGALDNPAGTAYPFVAAGAYAATAAVLLRRLPGLMHAAPAAVRPRPLGGADLGIVALATLGVFVLRLATFCTLAAVGQPGHVQTGLSGFRTAGQLGAVLTIVVGTTLGPLCEELLFRGTVYGALAAWMPRGAVLTSALVFAAARFDLVLAPFFVTYGIVLALTYRRTQNLLAPIAVRAIFDGTSYALLIWLGAGAPARPG